MCDEYGRLLKEYQKAVSKFSMALDALEASRATVRREEYLRMAGYVEQARVASEQARFSVEKHTIEHRCLSESATNTT